MSLLSRKLSVDFGERAAARFGGLFKRRETSGPSYLASLVRYGSKPSLGLIIEPNPNRSRPVIRLLGTIAGVLGKRCYPEIGNSVVVSDAVDVVDLFRFPLPVDIEPCEHVRSVQLAFADTNEDVALARSAASYSPGPLSIPFCGIFWAMLPAKFAGFCIVVQNRSHKLCRQRPERFSGHMASRLGNVLNIAEWHECRNMLLLIGV